MPLLSWNYVADVSADRKVGQPGLSAVRRTRDEDSRRYLKQSIKPCSSFRKNGAR